MIVLCFLELALACSCHFPHLFQTWPLKSIPSFRPVGGHKMQHYLFTLKQKLCHHCKKKDFLKSIHHFRICMLQFLSYSFGTKTTNTWIHNRSSLVNHTRFKTKMGKIYTRFRTKTVQKPYPLGGTYLYITYIHIWLI